MGLWNKLFGNKDDLVLREPKFGGMLYPDDPKILRSRIDALLDGVSATSAGGEPAGGEPGQKPPRAVIVAQGDYAVAGPAMAMGWASLTAASDRVARVVLVGSSRLVPFRGIAVTAYEGFSTPIGPLVVDRQALAGLVEDDRVRPIEAAFDPEASLEVQLPFVRRVLGEVSVIPLLVGDATDDGVADILGGFLDDPKTVVCVSANLSDDVSVEQAAKLDAQTQTAIEAADPTAIGRQHSHGRVAIRGLLTAVAARGGRGVTLGRQTSADQPQQPDASAGASGRVTGYGAFGFYPAG